MRKSILTLASFLTLSCSQKPENISETRLPPMFAMQGTISVERYSYGGAAGGYRYYVYGTSPDHEREVLYKGKSNNLLSLSFPDNRSILLDFCGLTTRQRRITKSLEWPGLHVKRLC